MRNRRQTMGILVVAVLLYSLSLLVLYFTLHRGGKTESHHFESTDAKPQPPHGDVDPKEPVKPPKREDKPHPPLTEAEKQELLKKKDLERNEKRLYGDDHTTSPLIEHLLKKYRGYRNGEIKPFHALINPAVGGFCNNLRGLFSSFLYTIFADTITLVHNGIGAAHKGNMMDYFSCRNASLGALLRYENHKYDARWGIKKWGANAYYKKYNDNDPKIVELVGNSLIRTVREIDGEHCHYCRSGLCKALRDKDTLKLSFVSTFGAKYTHPTGNSVIPHANNNFYAPHIFASKRKTEFLCNNLHLCRGIKKYVMDDSNKYINRKSFPSVGYQYYGSVLGGNLFRDLFDLAPRLKVGFAEFVKSHVIGSLVGVQIRYFWNAKAPSSSHQCPPYGVWVKRVGEVLDKIQEGQWREKNEVEHRWTIFLSVDEYLPDSVVKSFEKGLRRDKGPEDYMWREVKVLSKRNYPFKSNVGRHGQSYEYMINQGESAVLSTLYDFMLMSYSDVSFMTFMSSFGAVSTAMSPSFPPYVLYHGKTLLSAVPKGINRPRMYSFWGNRWKEIKKYKWLDSIYSIEGWESNHGKVKF